MSSLGWLIAFFVFLCFLVILVYVIVVRAFYWGDKKEPPKFKHSEDKSKAGEEEG